MLKLFDDVTKELSRLLRARYGEEIEALVVYGSVARGEARWSKDVDDRSDIDILVLTTPGANIQSGVLDILYDLDLQRETVTNPVFRTKDQLEDHYLRGDPFTVAVLDQGKVLYDRGGYARLRSSLLGEGK